MTATTAVMKNGTAAIRVNGDNVRYRKLSPAFKGAIEIKAWLFPATDHNTNFMLFFGNTLVSPVVHRASSACSRPWPRPAMSS